MRQPRANDTTLPRKSRRGQFQRRLSVLAAALLVAMAIEAPAAQSVLSWVDNANNETGFKIERAAGTGAFVEVATAAANATSYTDTTAAAATTYTYRVLAYNSVGNSAYSNVALVTFPTSGANTAPTISDIANRTINRNTSTGAVAFTVGDAETAAGSLIVSGTSSNTALVPHAAITFGGSGANRTVTVTPVANQSGVATITITVSDATLTATDTLFLTVAAVASTNTAPTISDIGSRTINEGSNTGGITFVIADAETAAGSLIVSGTSSNTALVPHAAITFGGSGANRTVTVTPAVNQSGVATITVTVSDGTLSASDAFMVTVSAINSAPTISALADRTIPQDGTTGAIIFTVGDTDTSAGTLIVSGVSSHPTLVASSAISFGGAGANRTVTITPVAGQAGTTTIAITVSDGIVSSTESFALNVTPVGPADGPPTITAVADQTRHASGAIGPLAFTVADNDTGAASLAVFATSSNPAVVPLGGITLGGSGNSRHITITPAAGQSGSATITVTVSDGTHASSITFTVTFTTTPPVASRMLNLSTRVVCRPSQESLIPGFVISGSAPKRVLLRAVGPTLGMEPFNLPGTLPDPRIVLKRWNGATFVDVATNDNWATNANVAEIRAMAESLLAFPMPDGSRDAALLLDLVPGQYTVVADDASGGNGVVILELYDADATPGGSALINMSNRGYVGAGAEVMISGFVVSNDGPATLLVRAVGPALSAAPFNVPGTISDPMIEIYRRNSDGSDTLIATHDNWGEAGDSAAIAELAARVSAFPLPVGGKDAAFVDTFVPGVYTAVVRGKQNAVGSALVEIYVID